MEKVRLGIIGVGGMGTAHLQTVGAGQVAGLTVVLASLWTIAGLQLAGLGLVGEYIGKVYLEAKGRPRYRIEEDLD